MSVDHEHFYRGRKRFVTCQVVTIKHFFHSAASNLNVCMHACSTSFHIVHTLTYYRRFPKIPVQVASTTCHLLHLVESEVWAWLSQSQLFIARKTAEMRRRKKTGLLPFALPGAPPPATHTQVQPNANQMHAVKDGPHKGWAKTSFIRTIVIYTHYVT